MLLTSNPGMLRAPESPRWLLATGAHASAEAAARKLWGPTGGLELGSAGAGTGRVKPSTGIHACWSSLVAEYSWTMRS
jgi:hypothetical protein